jgi:hypothetical protein
LRKSIMSRMILMVWVCIIAPVYLTVIRNL